MEPARRPDRLHAHRGGPAHRGDEPERRRSAAPDQFVAGRGADLVDERAHRPVLPDAAQFERSLDMAGRSDPPARTPLAYSRRGLYPGVGTGPALNVLSS